MHSLSRLWDKLLRMYKPDLMELKNEKAREEKKAALGLVVETLAKMEDEVLEDEDGAKKSCSSKCRRPN